MSIGDLSKLIRERLDEKKNNEKFDGRFVLSNQHLGDDLKESTITFRGKK